jgi:hypothetical protein
MKCLGKVDSYKVKEVGFLRDKVENFNKSVCECSSEIIIFLYLILSL